MKDFDIKVCNIQPTGVHTNMVEEYNKECPSNPLRMEHLLQPDDISDTVEYILNSSKNCVPQEILLLAQREIYENVLKSKL